MGWKTDIKEEIFTYFCRKNRNIEHANPYEGGQESLGTTEKERIKQNLDKCVELADKYGLSKLTMDEITAEVKAVRAGKPKG